MRKKATLSLRVSPEFKRRLTEEAKTDRRSVTNYIEVTLTRLWQEGSLKKLRRSKEGE
jgi:predicted HicB family RNase H-like nuclease